MLPSTLRVQNYRSFPLPQEVQLRPLTLFYGKNSAGKSALVRLLPLLADSMGSEDSAPLDLNSPAARRSTYADLRWKGRSEDDEDAPVEMSIELEWRDDPELARAEFLLDMEPTWRRLIIKRFAFFRASRAPLLRGIWRFRAEEQSSPSLTYALELGDERLEVPVRFRGLVPEAPEGRTEPFWATLRARLFALRRSVLWLGSRTVTERFQPRPAGPAWSMKSDGGDFGAVLASQPELLDEVSSWFSKNLQRALEVHDLPSSLFGLHLRHLAKAELDVDVLDSGEGVLKVLPVLTALALSRSPSSAAPRLLAIEEPESNLHPVLQRALAEHIGTLMRQDGALPCLLLETHSQHLLLGVQIQVAKGLLRPEQVQVYWVHQDEAGRSMAEPIHLDETGRLEGNWPPDVYTEVNDMSAELLLARRGRVRS
jgi:hypothetical protein